MSDLVNSTVLVAVVTVLGTVLTAIINKKDTTLKHGFEDVQTGLAGLASNLDEVKATTEATMDGTRKMQRYRLYHDLTKEIHQGYTTVGKLRELSILYESYSSLGGNGVIEVLFEKYKELEVRIEAEE